MHTPARDANLLGALAVVLGDRLDTATDPAPGPTAAAALVALAGPSARGSIDALASVVRLTHSGAVRLVDRLEGQGLVERRRGADQRSAALVLTPIGRRAAREVLRRREQSMHVLLALLTDDQQAALIGAAEHLLGELGAEPGTERRVCRLCDLDACGRSRGLCPVAPARRRRRQA
jgi:MarR family transcriptional repressor of emrRAB